MSTKDAVATQMLPVMEQFYTLQGEGRYAGHAAYFIRLGGCDVGCTWCDVKESWPMQAHPPQYIGHICRQAADTGAKIAVITGGEPALHPLAALTQGLRQMGLHTHIETSGSSLLTGIWDWITLSPKKFKAPLPQCLAQAHELKVVVYHPSDLAWAAHFLPALSPHCALLLQPEWSKRERITPILIDYIKANPQWQLSLQTHKYLHIP